MQKFSSCKITPTPRTAKWCWGKIYLIRIKKPFSYGDIMMTNLPSHIINSTLLSLCICRLSIIMIKISKLHVPCFVAPCEWLYIVMVVFMYFHLVYMSTGLQWSMLPASFINHGQSGQYIVYLILIRLKSHEEFSLIKEWMDTFNQLYNQY